MTMKRYLLILVLLFCCCASNAQTIPEKQTGICFNKVYFAESELRMGDTVKMQVKHIKSKFLCKITVYDNQLTGYLVKDTEKANRGLAPILYRFHTLKRPYLFFFISFHVEDGEAKAIIFNQYAEVFKPGFDVRGFELTLEK